MNEHCRLNININGAPSTYPRTAYQVNYNIDAIAAYVVTV